MRLYPLAFHNPVDNVYEVLDMYGEVVVSFATLDEAEDFILENK